MDLGCHGIAFCYWFLGRQAIKSVYAQLGTYVHADKTRGDDEAVCIIEFEDGAIGLVECSWGKRGGMFDKTEIYGEGGVTYADLHMGNALPTYSEYGFGYAVEKAPTTVGWSYPVFEEHWNYGIPQEMRHFARMRARKRNAPGEWRRRARCDAGAVRSVCFSGGGAKDQNAIHAKNLQTH